MKRLLEAARQYLSKDTPTNRASLREAVAIDNIQSALVADCVVYVAWSRHPRVNEETVRYQFASPEELAAFRYGIMEANSRVHVEFFSEPHTNRAMDAERTPEWRPNRKRPQ